MLDPYGCLDFVNVLSAFSTRTIRSDIKIVGIDFDLDVVCEIIDRVPTASQAQREIVARMRATS